MTSKWIDITGILELHVYLEVSPTVFHETYSQESMGYNVSAPFQDGGAVPEPKIPPWNEVMTLKRGPDPHFEEHCTRESNLGSVVTLLATPHSSH